MQYIPSYSYKSLFYIIFFSSVVEVFWWELTEIFPAYSNSLLQAYWFNNVVVGILSGFCIHEDRTALLPVYILYSHPSNENASSVYENILATVIYHKIISKRVFGNLNFIIMRPSEFFWLIAFQWCLIHDMSPQISGYRVGWSCWINRQHLCGGVRLPQRLSRYMTLNNLMVRSQ